MSDPRFVYRVLEERFGELAAPVPTATLEDVRKFVRNHVTRLLDQNPGLLMSILYRIDVAEPKVQEVMETAQHETIIDRLTDLIVERQLEKVRMRHEYRNDSEH